MASEYRYFITCPQCGTESPEPAFGRRAECVCPCCNETKIEPRSDGHGFDRYFDRISTAKRGTHGLRKRCPKCRVLRKFYRPGHGVGAWTKVDGRWICDRCVLRELFGAPTSARGE